MDGRLIRQFPPLKLGPFEKPTTLVDCCGRILIWCLPEVLDVASNVR